MENNDILIRVRYALDIKDNDMVKIFKLGGVDVTKEDVLTMLTKPKDDFEEDDWEMKINNTRLESFFNGLVTFKRGPREKNPASRIQPQLL
ncbi:cytoplasmic protein [Bacillus sp. B-jedd]|nr:cytoplasmic protein [Bacillus sp. B-jedd]